MDGAACGAGTANGSTNTSRPTNLGIYFTFIRACASSVGRMQVRHKRRIYNNMRKPPDMHPDSFLPKYGLTVGEFSTFDVLAPEQLQLSAAASAACGPCAASAASAASEDCAGAGGSSSGGAALLAPPPSAAAAARPKPEARTPRTKAAAGPKARAVA